MGMGSELLLRLGDGALSVGCGCLSRRQTAGRQTSGGARVLLLGENTFLQHWSSWGSRGGNEAAWRSWGSGNLFGCWGGGGGWRDE